MEHLKDPMEIENESMRLIRPYLAELSLPEDLVPIYSRVVHASGDPDYAKHIKIASTAVKAMSEAIENGADIFCDVEMVRTGINKKRLAVFGGSVHCLISDETVAIKAKELGVTRSLMAMRTFGEKMHGAIVAIGNAPTALFEVLNIMDKTAIRPACIVGVPVGFVGAAESKEALSVRSKAPYITVQGNKGGSSIAAAIINAVLYLKGR
jgi:precorrin-8X/cobalt-precorrin-8 methylmutase